MSQTVLKNQVTDLEPRSAMDAQQRGEVASALADTLADAYRLFINTQGLHWNVEGPLFYSIHKLTESQYEELFEAIDRVAERIRALGLPAPQGIKEISERSVLADLPRDATLEQRIAHMISDYERATQRLSLVARLAETHGDIKSADLLTERIGVYDDNAWMLRATIAS